MSLLSININSVIRREIAGSFHSLSSSAVSAATTGTVSGADSPSANAACFLAVDETVILLTPSLHRY